MNTTRENIRIARSEVLRDTDNGHLAVLRISGGDFIIARDKDARRTPYLFRAPSTLANESVLRVIEARDGDKVAFDGKGDVWVLDASTTAPSFKTC